MVVASASLFILDVVEVPKLEEPSTFDLSSARVPSIDRGSSEISIDDEDFELDSALDSDADDYDELDDLVPEFTVEPGPFIPTNAAPGSNEKIETLALRYARGHPLWHSEDRSDLEGQCGVERSELGKDDLDDLGPVDTEGDASDSEIRLKAGGRPTRASAAELVDADDGQSNASGRISRIRVPEEPAPASGIHGARKSASEKSAPETVLVPSGPSHDTALERRREERVTELPASVEAKRSNPAVDEICTVYEMFRRGVASGGLAASDLQNFIKENRDLLQSAGVL